MRALAALPLLVALAGLASCASVKPAPAMAVMHYGSPFCVSYIQGMQTEAQPLLMVTQGPCPVIVEE